MPFIYLCNTNEQIEYHQLVDVDECSCSVEALSRAKRVDPYAVYMGLGYLKNDEYCEEQGQEKIYHVFQTM
jgi:hypothetical protein